MLLSVVVPAYNNAAFIQSTIESILTQDFDDFELLVADHASTDGTWEILQALPPHPRLKLLQTPAGGGAAANWNRVTRAASGRYLRLVCGDDLVMPGSLRAQVTALEANPDAHLAASPRKILDAQGNEILSRWGLRNVRSKTMPGSVAIVRTVRAGTNIFGEPGSVTVRRATLDEIGGWDARFPYLIDEVTYVKILMRKAFIPLGEVGAAFRLSATQWSVSLARSQAEQAWAFHRWLRAEYPDVVSRLDVVRGDTRALLMSIARRAAYVLYARRMRLPATNPEASGAPSEARI